MDNTKLEKAVELIRSFQTGILVTFGMQDRPHMRPMRVAGVDDDLAITFVTSLESVKIDEVRRRSTIGLSFQSKDAFVALDGHGVVVTDAQEKKAAWEPLAGLGFEGPADPDAALIRFQPETIEYWDQRGLNSLRLAFNALRAAATGNEPDDSPSIHGRVTI